MKFSMVIWTPQHDESPVRATADYYRSPEVQDPFILTSMYDPADGQQGIRLVVSMPLILWRRFHRYFRSPILQRSCSG